MKKLYILVVALVLFVSSCSQPAVGTPQGTNNPNVPVEVLFQKDGYTIYRFWDNGRAYYYVVPQGQVVNTHSESCGKGCIQELNQNIQTQPKKGLDNSTK